MKNRRRSNGPSKRGSFTSKFSVAAIGSATKVKKLGDSKGRNF
jgi:hypothetical protein